MEHTALPAQGGKPSDAKTASLHVSATGDHLTFSLVYSVTTLAALDRFERRASENSKLKFSLRRLRRAETDSYSVCMGGVPESTSVSLWFAVAVGVLSLVGSAWTSSLWPALYGLSYAACFTLALRGVPSPFQVVLVLAMVGLSFGLHLVFLPAGTMRPPAAAHTTAEPTDKARPGRHLLLLQPDDM